MITIEIMFYLHPTLFRFSRSIQIKCKAILHVYGFIKSWNIGTGKFLRYDAFSLVLSLDSIEVMGYDEDANLHVHTCSKNT